MQPRPIRSILRALFAHARHPCLANEALRHEQATEPAEHGGKRRARDQPYRLDHPRPPMVESSIDGKALVAPYWCALGCHALQGFPVGEPLVGLGLSSPTPSLEGEKFPNTPDDPASHKCGQQHERNSRRRLALATLDLHSANGAVTHRFFPFLNPYTRLTFDRV